MKHHLPKEYCRDCEGIRFHFGEWLQPAEVIKRDPDAPQLIQDVIERAAAKLEVRMAWRDRHHPFHWLYDRNQLLTLQWMLSGERELLHELTHTQH